MQEDHSRIDALSVRLVDSTLSSLYFFGVGVRNGAAGVKKNNSNDNKNDVGK
jgi:hypothetical protein